VIGRDRLYEDLRARLDRESRGLHPLGVNARELVPLKEAARRMGRDPDYVRMLAKSGLILARRDGDEFLVEPVILSLVSGPTRSRPADRPRYESNHDHRDERDDHPIEHGEAAAAAIAASVSPSTVLGQDHPQR
jgi:hypothetical protein